MRITKKIGNKEIVNREVASDVVTMVAPTITTTKEQPNIKEIKLQLKKDIKQYKKPTKLGKLFMKIVFGVIIFDVVSITFLVILMNL